MVSPSGVERVQRAYSFAILHYAVLPIADRIRFAIRSLPAGCSDSNDGVNSRAPAVCMGGDEGRPSMAAAAAEVLFNRMHCIINWWHHTTDFPIPNGRPLARVMDVDAPVDS